MGQDYSLLFLFLSSRDEGLWIRSAEEGIVLHSLCLHVLQHGIEVHSYLNASFHILLPILHHQLSVSLCNGSNLHSHIGFIDCHDKRNEISKPLCNHLGITLEIEWSILSCPATLLYKPHRGSEVHKSDHRHNSIFLHEGKFIPVVLNLLFVKYALFRLNPCPFDGEAVTVEPGFL